MQFVADNISYTYPDGKRIFNNIDFSLDEGEKAALVGDNGSGKTTLLQILAGSKSPDLGTVSAPDSIWMVPQHFGQYDSCTVAEALQVEHKIEALQAIEEGSVAQCHYDTIANDWSIHARLRSALDQWDLTGLSPDTKLSTLSGGQKTKVFLSGISIHEPELVLMDEPTNHLDYSGRKHVCDMIQESNHDFLIVSHDRELLDICNPIYELSSLGIKKYGGNYSFYEEQKQIEMEAIQQQIHHTRQSISGAKKKQREALERKQKLNARGGKKARKEGIPKIMIGIQKNSAENSTSKLDEVHNQKISKESERLQELKEQERRLLSIKITLKDSSLHTGKVLFEAVRINYNWPDTGLLWKEPLRFTIHSGDRVRITGNNGSGKSTLLRLLNEDIKPTSGKLKIQSEKRFLLDQDYRIIDRNATVVGQVLASNDIKKPEHEVKTLLHRYLFDESVWDQSCNSLSGGEMMRLSLCCLSLQALQPDTIILDEPTNNLDLRNLKILTEAISDYKGTLIVVSHDQHFVRELNLDKTIDL